MTDIDLVLSGSGIRFGAYFSAIKALEELGYNPVRVCGTSGGAIAGALYSSGLDIDFLIEQFYKFELKKFRSFSLWGSIKHFGLYSNKYIATKLDELTSGMTLAEAPKEFHAITTGERSGLTILNKYTAPDMTLGEAARMSAPMPFYFQRIPWKDDYYMDGGVVSGYPIDTFDNERKLVGLKVQGNKGKPRGKSTNIIRYGLNMLRVMMNMMDREHIEDAYWAKTIVIPTGDIDVMDFNMSQQDREFLIDTGYKSVMKYKDKL